MAACFGTTHAANVIDQLHCTSYHEEYPTNCSKCCYGLAFPHHWQHRILKPETNSIAQGMFRQD
jgi:hypothetical protein